MAHRAPNDGRIAEQVQCVEERADAALVEQAVAGKRRPDRPQAEILNRSAGRPTRQPPLRVEAAGGPSDERAIGLSGRSDGVGRARYETRRQRAKMLEVAVPGRPGQHVEHLDVARRFRSRRHLAAKGLGQRRHVIGRVGNQLSRHGHSPSAVLRIGGRGSPACDAARE
jgi:hypothetical protein